MTLSLSFALIEQLSHLFLKTFCAGFFLFAGGIFLMLLGSGPFKKPNQKSLRRVLGVAKKSPAELIFAILGLILVILALITVSL